MGDCGSVRELWDFGERAWEALALREPVLLVLAGAVLGPGMAAMILARFFGRSRSKFWFSLSDPIISVL
jgi:hypothetical protein